MRVYAAEFQGGLSRCPDPEADEFYDDAGSPPPLGRRPPCVQSSPLAASSGTSNLITMTFSRWLKGDPLGPEPPRER